DTWFQANSPEHYDKLLRGDRPLVELTMRQLCVRSLRLCKQLPNSPITWLFLVLLGSMAAAYGLLVDNWVRTLFRFRRVIIESVGTDSFLGFMCWSCWCVTLAMLATCCGHFISPASDGSGIPVMRALFAGVYQNPGDMLSFRTLVAKSLSTVIASGSGLSIGRAGPFTHLMAMIGYLMGKLALFRRVSFGQENYNFIRAAVACGTTANFGAPLGGLLFSIEVTAKYYQISCLWEGIICSSVCILVFNVITFLKRDVLFERTTFPGFDMDYEIFAFVLLGVVTGIAAGIYCRLAVLLRSTQMKLFTKLGLTGPSLKRRTVHIVSICVGTAILTYPLGIMRLSDRSIVNEVFRDQNLSFPQWKQISDYPQVTLFVYIVLKFMTSLLPCGAPISMGVFGPLFTIGAAVGRLYGETLMKYWNPTQSPATYAVVGASCFAASATQTVSTAVIFFELTSQLSHMVPVMTACTVSYFVCGAISPSIYDILAGWAGLHSVCYDLNEHVLSQKIAQDYMSPITVFFTKETTYDEAIQALNIHKKEEYFPVCDNPESQMLIGCIRRYDLEIAVARFIAAHRKQMPNAKDPNISLRVEKLVSKILDIDKKKSAVVEDYSLVDFQPKDATSLTSPLELGPPFSDYSFTSVPVESYPPQVSEDVNLYRVHKIAAMSEWTKVYVVRLSKLLGVINLDSSLTKLRTEEDPVMLAP
ncbi:Chloride Channel (ClC) protein, partial [Phytophthora megakarya]